MAFDHAPVLDFGITLSTAAAKLRLGRLGVVALQDPGLRLRHLTERPEGDAVPYGNERPCRQVTTGPDRSRGRR